MIGTNNQPKAQSRVLVLGAAAYVWTTLNDLLGGLVFVLLEVLHEELAELLHFALEIGSAVPGLGGVEELIGDVGAGLGDGETEGFVCLILDVCELARVDGIKDRTGVFERATLRR
jgi:hypothetical protein